MLIATPIGNLGDLSPRARSVLAEADLICCEDTRRTRALLSAFEIRAGNRLVSLHGDNETSRLERVTQSVAAGGTVAVVSDAGTPGISDPGAWLAGQLAAQGERVTVVPGPSSVLAALVVSGLPTDRFSVEGFLPRKGPARRERLAALARDPRTTVLFESPHRVMPTLGDLVDACGPDRAAVVARELTKRHEEVFRGTLAAARTHVEATPPRGEYVLVLAGAGAADAPTDDDLAAEARAALEAGMSARDAAAHVAGRLGVSRRRAYDVVVACNRGGSGAPGR